MTPAATNWQGHIWKQVKISATKYCEMLASYNMKRYTRNQRKRRSK